jgi:AmmeMemoRadiSam system protein B
MNGNSEVRRRSLRYGWYPERADEILEYIYKWTRDIVFHNAYAVVSPHAGWAFSGPLSAKAIWALETCETIVVIGGHLGTGSPILYAEENWFETVPGEIEADSVLLNATIDELKDEGIGTIVPDVYADNSVEVLLPLIKAKNPEGKILWFRCPPSYLAKELGTAVARAAMKLGRKACCIGSTDLTHYGPNYDFEPEGRGERAHAWVRNINDKMFLEHLVKMDGDAALNHALRKKSACSAGAAVASLGFAMERGADTATIIGYTTSLEVHEDDSFVGYGAVAFGKGAT